MPCYKLIWNRQRKIALSYDTLPCFMPCDLVTLRAVTVHSNLACLVSSKRDVLSRYALYQGLVRFRLSCLVSSCAVASSRVSPRFGPRRFAIPRQIHIIYQCESKVVLNCRGMDFEVGGIIGIFGAFSIILDSFSFDPARFT